MKNIFICAYLLLISCSDFSNNIVGVWIYSDELYELELEKSVNKSIVDLSVIYSDIRMHFEDDEYETVTRGQYNQITSGNWRIEKDSLFLSVKKILYIEIDKATYPNIEWRSYKYKMTDNTLIIYDKEYILAFYRGSD